MRSFACLAVVFPLWVATLPAAATLTASSAAAQETEPAAAVPAQEPPVSNAQETEAQALTAPKYPIAIANSADGTRYVVDRNLPGVWTIKEGQASVLVTGSKRNREPLNAPRCIAVSAEGRVFVGDSSGCNVYEVSADAPPRPLSSERIGIPMGLAIDSNGVLYIADLELHRILKLTPGDAPVAPETAARVRAPRALACDSQNRVWIVSGYENPIRRLNADASVDTIVAGTPLPYPAGIAIGPDDSIWVTDSYDRSVVRISDSGEITPVAKAESMVYPIGIAIDGEGVVVVDSRAPGLHRINAAGEVAADFPR